MLALFSRCSLPAVTGVLVTLSMSAAAQDTAAARERWRAAAIDDYEYSYQRVCECHPDQLADTIVTVSDGIVVAVRYAREDYVEDIPVAENRLQWFRTIEDLFALVETAAAGDAEVRATFDPQRGYPTTIYVDYVRDLVGDEVDLTITAFRPLGPAGRDSG